MKPFNLEQAKAGKPVQTRDGRSARIICFDAKNLLSINGGYIVALVYSYGAESVYSYSLTGRCDFIKECDSDLVMVPENKSGWINIYRDNETGDIYETKERAIAESRDFLVDTIYIEWKE